MEERQCGNCRSPTLRIVRDEGTGERIGYECVLCGWRIEKHSVGVEEMDTIKVNKAERERIRRIEARFRNNE